jgi:hypothetical protein
MSTQNSIKCPNCGTEIDVNEIVYHQLNDDLNKKYNDKLAKEVGKLEDQKEALSGRSAEIERQEKALEEQIETGVRKQVAAETERIVQREKARAEEEQSERIKLLQRDLDAQSTKLKGFNKSLGEIEKLKREKDELRDKIEAESEQRLSKQLTEEKEKIHKAEASRNSLKISEKNHVIDQLKEQLRAAHRKAEQGSGQIQGEVQELAIEAWLRGKFPLDGIEEVKKGASGADCVQTVNTRSRKNCGTIYYESKRTKAFQPSWIEKFRNDIRDKNADIGVLVTEVMPNDMDRMGMRDGVWVCTFDEFKGLCQVLRESIILVSNTAASQENKGDKMEMLYGFLTSNEFRLQVEGIVEGFTQMQQDLETERRSIQGHWKKREKQIQKVLLNTNHMYSSVRGIAGSAIQSVPLLELEEDNDDEDLFEKGGD